MKAVNKEEQIKIRCVFCGGKGKDPFGLLSERSTCHVCGGIGEVTIGKSFMKCAYCKGSGNYKSYSCNVCGGKGFVQKLKGDIKICPDCYGSGEETPSGMECLTCHGKGVVLARL